jgi:hypothetical protein
MTILQYLTDYQLLKKTVLYRLTVWLLLMLTIPLLLSEKQTVRSGASTDRMKAYS